MAIDLKNILNYVAPAPTYLGKLEEAGMITSNDLDALRNRSLVQGLLTAGLGYLAQPKTGRYGSALPYLGKAGLMGLQAMDEPYKDYMRGFEFSNKLEQAKQAKDKEARRKELVEKLRATGNYDDLQMGAIEMATEDALLQLTKPMKPEKKTNAERFVELLTLKDTDGLTKTQEAELKALEKVVTLTSPTGGALQQSPYGTPQAGFTWKRNKDGSIFINPETQGPEVIPIVGSKEYEERKAEIEKKEVGGESKATIAGTVIADAQRAIDMIKNSPKLTTGPIAFATKDIGTGPAYTTKLMIESVKSNIGIDTLLRIKESGAGLGQIPQKQLETLQSVLGGLDQGQDAETLLYNLERVKEIYSDIVQKVGGQELLDQMIEKSIQTPERKKLQEEQGFTEGQIITTKSGKKAIYRNGQFEYIEE